MTSIVQPPVLNPSLGTPSNEWAEKTASSFDPSSQGMPKNTTSGQATGQSPGVTPGSELPGAFPSRGQGESSDTTNITETIVDTAKYYLPAGVVNTVETILGGNDSTRTTEPDKEVRASEHDIYHKTSLPSQELRGALPHEHVGGVGSLPGASIEKSVALLPDEQAEWSEWETFAGRNTPGYQTPSNPQGNVTGVSQPITQKKTNLGVAAGIVKADVPPKQMAEDVGKGHPNTLASGDIPGAQQAVENIKPGSLPGPKDEQDVAVLTEERATKTTETVRPEHREEQGHPDETKPTSATDPMEYTRLRDPPTKTAPSAGSEPAQPEPKNLSSTQRPSGSEDSTEGQHKASLKEKISGGMKIVSGKLGHDKSKVEEGKKLMHGQSA
ncbi:hypothetical protein BDM02DRAFT_3189402 [Thelephora ganbajun]|uniref:Uncharacterized protein n=1 Tax=Thelephora ganbajun TaxID=370292 RepID=A0ACB6Z825_THEGA|nr:hypothetical protein BDM02DRAFT_3189402 [Thelephora ganbajun]